MSTLNDQELAGALAELTRRSEAQPEVWKRGSVLAELEARQPRDVIGRILSAPIPRGWLAIAAVVIIVIGTGIASQLMLDRSVDGEVSMSLSNRQNFGEGQRAAASPASDRTGDIDGSSGIPIEEPGMPGAGGRGGAFLSGGGVPMRRPLEDETEFVQDESADVVVDRSIIRKATIELVSADVRAAYLRAAQLISQARGEFIDDSVLQGAEGTSLTAHLTLRIRADRLDQVLNDLRQLGTVVSEEARGEDVTGQVVDLDARIRNEERVEQELLDLLAQREDAPLKEILELRGEISRVRGRIEQYSAQHQNLSKLVSLATVLVIIRPDARAEDEDEGEEESIGEHFAGMIGDAWDGGIRFLAGSIAVIIRSLVGGAIWIGLALLAFGTIRYARQAANRSGQDSNLRPAA